VVVTLRHGHPLIGPDGALPVLAPHALLWLAADVLAGIKELQVICLVCVVAGDARGSTFS
jgi:hypothetical protein